MESISTCPTLIGRGFIEEFDLINSDPIFRVQIDKRLVLGSD